MNNYIVILGAGESGTGAAILAKKKGFDVFVSDAGKIKDKYKNQLNTHDIAWEEDTHSVDKILSANLIIKSPGIADKTQIIKDIKTNKIAIISEIEFASRYTNATKICITGTNGKTTTTLLTYHILKNAGLNVGLAGNVGLSFARQVAENDHDFYVIELSSFQLDYMFEFKADIAVLLNITPDHLDRYNYVFQNYIDSKFRIIQNQTAEDHFIFSSDDNIINQELNKRNVFSQKYPISVYKTITGMGGYLDNNKILITTTKNLFNMEQEKLALEGKHNTTNSLAAGIVSNILEIKKDNIRDCLANFKGVEHRLENLQDINGVHFVNDSKATNVNSVWYALECMKNKVILIMGGVDKGNDYSEIMDLIRQKVKTIVAMGTDNQPIIAAFKNMVEIIETNNIKDAVKSAFLLATPGETVLLSPACASFDLFENYEDRGNKFKEEVRKLA